MEYSVWSDKAKVTASSFQKHLFSAMNIRLSAWPENYKVWYSLWRQNRMMKPDADHSDTEPTIAGADTWAQRSLLSKKSATGHLSEETFKWTWICEAESLLSSLDLPQSLSPPASSFPMLGL